MTLSVQEISDRFEIQDLVFRYSEAVDTKEFEALREVFTEDAHIDYTAFGVPAGGLNEVITFLGNTMKMFPNHQHLNTNLQVRVDGDKATGKVMCLNPQEMAMPGGKTHIFMCGLWYIDEYRRTEEGWRISNRVQEKSYVFNPPNFAGGA